jgi:hypothetical protein
VSSCSTWRVRTCRRQTASSDDRPTRAKPLRAGAANTLRVGTGTRMHARGDAREQHMASDAQATGVQTVGFEPTTSRVQIDNPRQRPESGRKAIRVLALSLAELRLQSEWQELHLRPRAPKARALLLGHIQIITSG